MLFYKEVIAIETFHFQLSGSWQGGRAGSGRLDTKTLSVNVSAPAELGGAGAGTNPDELLLAAAANCYMITLASILEKRDLNVARFECNSEATVELDGGNLRYKRITHRPVIALQGGGERRITLVEQFTRRAEKACMVSQALRGNVEVHVEPEIIIT